MLNSNDDLTSEANNTELIESDSDTSSKSKDKNKFTRLEDYNLDPVAIDSSVSQIRVTFEMNKNVSSLFEN